MSKLTEILKLFCYDPATDGANTFNIPKALNENWEKIDAALAPLGGATTAQAALAALGAGVRPNLLDNAYFVGGGTGWGVFPVNQRGVSGTISTPGYFIDRWKLVSGTVQITSAGLVLNGTIAQILPSSIGSVCTATALTTTGVVTCQYDDASRIFTITGTGQTFIFAKLERGVGQTAAYQDADNAWHMLPQQGNDYATQLAKCQSDLLVFATRGSNVAYLAYGFAETTAKYRFSLPTPSTMRRNPVMTYTGGLFVIAHGTRVNITSISALWQPNQNSINIIAEVESEGVADEFAMLGIGYEDSTLVLQCP